jgi:hypothetical protein
MSRVSASVFVTLLLLGTPLYVISLFKSSSIKQNFHFTRLREGLQAAVGTAAGPFAQSFVQQKNSILLEKLQNPVNGNVTEAAFQYVNFCDESFDSFIGQKISSLPDEKDKQIFGKIRYAVNSARQQKLMEADKILRGILAAGGLKQMEAKLYYHLKRVEIDMAFMVLLQLNIEDALVSNVTQAVQVMTHLGTIINEQQDAMVSAPVRLLRLLVRTDDSNIRKQMLRQKILIGENIRRSQSDSTAIIEGKSEIEGETEAQSTLSPQCENIVVSAVQSWGGADVTVKELQDTITDVLSQVILMYMDIFIDREHRILTSFLRMKYTGYAILHAELIINLSRN